jgi:hypothetical protein
MLVRETDALRDNELAAAVVATDKDVSIGGAGLAGAATGKRCVSRVIASCRCASRRRPAPLPAGARADEDRHAYGMNVDEPTRVFSPPD